MCKYYRGAQEHKNTRTDSWIARYNSSIATTMVVALAIRVIVLSCYPNPNPTYYTYYTIVFIRSNFARL